MKKISFAIVSLFLFALVACSSTTNPLSSEYDEGQDNNDTIQMSVSGGSEHG